MAFPTYKHSQLLNVYIIFQYLYKIKIWVLILIYLWESLINYLYIHEEGAFQFETVHLHRNLDIRVTYKIEYQ